MSPTWPVRRPIYLLFDYPLTGTYEFSLSRPTRARGPTRLLTHDGLVIEPFTGEGRVAREFSRSARAKHSTSPGG